jgi:DNA polymerase elongation subunit (family B)
MNGKSEVFFDIETTGLDPFNSHLISIQIRISEETIIWKEWEEGEEKIIKHFLDFTDSIYRKETRFIGYNILKFDIPFITQRMRNLSILNENTWTTLYRSLSWFDLYQFLGDWYGRFKDWSLGLSGTSSDTVNKQIPDLYSKKEYMTIVTYINTEMTNMERVYESMQKQEFFKELQALRRKVLG